MGVWEAMEFLNTLVDDSDPDTDLSQIEHLLQTAEAIRRDGHPRWFVLTGLIHDLGKILCLFGEPQWAVVGDTFPVGCAFSDKIVFPEFFADNPDAQVPEYQTPCGIYEPGCGLDSVHLSWGHDEYLYHVVKDYLPEPSAVHDPLPLVLRRPPRGGVRPPDERPRPRDVRVGAGVQPVRPVLQGARPGRTWPALRPYYEELIAEFFPPTLAW